MKLELSAPNWRYYFNVAFRSPRPGLKAHRLTELPAPSPACLVPPQATSGPGVAGCHLERVVVTLLHVIVPLPCPRLSDSPFRLGPRAARAAWGCRRPPQPPPTALGVRLWRGDASGDSDPAPSARTLPRDPGTPGPALLSAQCRPRPIPSAGFGLLLVLPFCVSPRPAPPQNFRAQPLTLAFVPGVAWVGRLSI